MALDIDDRMFDFKVFYDRMIYELPNNSVVAEVGVADGASALYLAEGLHSVNKSFTLYMIDNMDYGKNEQLSTLIQNVIASGFQKSVKIIPLDSLNASCKFNDDFFDFVYLDSSHKYEQTKAEIRLWYRKVKDSGILAGHDYNEYPDDVGKAVRELIAAYINRDTLYDDAGEIQQEFEPEKFLHIESTRDKFGLWWIKKDFYKKIQ